MRCASKYCYFNNIAFISPEEEKNIKITPCTYCKSVLYCSERCKNYDWYLFVFFDNNFSSTNYILFQKFHLGT